MGWGNERESKQICLNLRNLRICERAGAVAVLGWAADSILKQSNYQWASNEKKVTKKLVGLVERIHLRFLGTGSQTQSPHTRTSMLERGKGQDLL